MDKYPPNHMSASRQSPIDRMADAIRAADPALTPDQASEIAASIGDRPVCMGRSVIGYLGTEEYLVERSIILPDDDDDDE